MTTDVIIIGAGIAGLTAARELARHRVSFALLEAADHAGGRACTLRMPSGVAIDLGAHWLHGEDNPLKDMLDEYRIPYAPDDAGEMRIYKNGAVQRRRGADWLMEAVDKEKARHIKEGTMPDCAIPDLAVDSEARQLLSDFSLMWDGIDPPVEPSAREFLTDENTPGGLQLMGGIAALIERMVIDIGARHLQFSMPVESILSGEDGVRIVTVSGEEWTARKAIFTGSLGVIKSGLVNFQPPLSQAMRKELAGMVMGKMNKIIVELDPRFFAERTIPENLSLELLDAEPPHFCHVRSAGKPLISLFVAGQQAARVEHLSPAEALDYLRDKLAPVKELEGFETHVIGEPIVTRWVSNPHTLGAYSACLPGGNRSWLREEGNIYFSGDTFDTRFPASMAGAARSGKVAARMAAYALASVAALAARHA